MLLYNIINNEKLSLKKVGKKLSTFLLFYIIINNKNSVLKKLVRNYQLFLFSIILFIEITSIKIMIKVFSQKINQDSFNIVYDCLINHENNNVGYTHIYEYPNGTQINSFFVMDFISLREFINNGKTNYQNEKFQFIEKEGSFDIISHKEKLSISLPKNFLFDSYDVLENMWEDD